MLPSCNLSRIVQWQCSSAALRPTSRLSVTRFDATLCYAAGSLFLFDRNQLKSFRRDNHKWRSKAGGKTVQETHEKLKVRYSVWWLRLLAFSGVRATMGCCAGQHC